MSLKLYYQNKLTITEYTIVTLLVKGDHKRAKLLIVCGSLPTLRTQNEKSYFLFHCSLAEITFNFRLLKLGNAMETGSYQF